MTFSPASTPNEYEELNWLHGRFGRVGTAATIYVAFCSGWVLSGWGSPAVRAIVTDLAYAPLAILSVILCAIIWRNQAIEPAFRRTWGVMGLAMAANLVAGAVWIYEEATIGRLPSTSWADLFLLAGYWLVAVAFISFPHPPLSRIDKFRNHLDVTIILVALWMSIWFFASQPEANILQFAANPAPLTPYPIMDLPLIYGMLVFIFHHPNVSLRSSIGLLIGGFLLTVVGDIIFSIQQFRGAYVNGTPLESLWYIGYLLFIYAALIQYAKLKAHGAAFTGARPNPYLWLLPYVMLFFGYLLIAVEFAATAAFTITMRGLFGGAAALTLLALVRQFIDLYEIRRLNTELVRRLKQLEETGSALNRAQHLASLGTLAAGVAHEINNPIGVIAAAAEMLHHQTVTEQWKQEIFLSNLGRIRRSAWHASKIARSLLAYSRGGVLSLNRTSARALIDDALAHLPTEGDVHLTVDVNPETPTIVCDHDQITQVLMNLIDNALDAVNDSSSLGMVAVTAGRHVNGGITFTVTDSGSGIAADTLARVFDPFYTTKPVGKGTGLGLSICRGIVQAHDGQLSIESRLGAGTTATFSLPPEPHSAPPAT